MRTVKSVSRSAGCTGEVSESRDGTFIQWRGRSELWFLGLPYFEGTLQGLSRCAHAYCKARARRGRDHVRGIRAPGTIRRSARPARERGTEQQISSRGPGQQRELYSPRPIRGRLRGLRRPYACPPSPTRSLSSRLAGEPSSGTQGVSCCFSTSLSPGSVSAQSTPHASTLARLPCAHLRAETHFNRYLLIQRSCVRSYAPSVQRIDARGFGKVKQQTARRHGINIYDQIPRG